jgi:hypothetical protein
VALHVPRPFSVHTLVVRQRAGPGKPAGSFQAFFRRQDLRKFCERILLGKVKAARSRLPSARPSIVRDVAQRCQFFSSRLLRRKSGIFEKDLALRVETHTVSPPFGERPLKKAADGIEGGDGRLNCSSLRSFLEIFGKRIDGEAAEVLVETLSLIGKLFEIYFVRLIGTPNQQFKK